MQIAAVLLASVFAEPEADPKAWYGSYGYPNAGLTYAGAYAGYPATYGYGLGYGYNGYALGAHYIGKRSADSDAEAKPWLSYSNYGYAGYPYAAGYAGAYGYPYASYGLGYNGYALGSHYIGKRSADAEAKPESWYGYGYAPYSHGYAPYGYGAYGLGYGYNGYAYGK